MRRRHVLLISGGVVAIAAALGGIAVTERRHAAEWRLTDSEYWYGFRLGMNASDIPGLPPPTSRSSTILDVPAPWSIIYVSFDPRGRLVQINLRDEGLETIACTEDPCPLKRLKSVERMRADGAHIRREMIERLGAPGSADRNRNEERLMWNFVRPEDCVGTPRPPLTDPTGRLDSVLLQLSDDAISLDVRGRDWAEQFQPPPGSPPAIPVPTPPPPPCPPSG